MRLPVIVSFLHKWIGLIIGIQIVLWVSGGVIMSWFPIQQVRGEHNVAEQEPAPLAAGSEYLPIGEALGRAGIAEASQVTLRPWLDRNVYEVRSDGTHLLDAATGERLSPLSEERARAVALADYAGEAEIIGAALMEETNVEYRGTVPVWRFDFADADKTHLYVSPDTGRVAARRNATWRLYDFFWMLHIMDYQDRENFNNPLVVSAAITALVMVLMGFALLFWRLRLRDWRVMFARAPKS